MSKIKSFISSLKLRWSDLLLLLGFFPFIVYLLYGHTFMEFADPNVVGLPVWAIIVLFIVIFISWGGYLYLEFKAGNQPKNYITWAFFIIAIVGLISILIQPRQSVENVVVRTVNEGNQEAYPGSQVGDIIPVTITLSSTHILFFATMYVLMIEFIYLGLFILPKRFTSIVFLKYLGYAIFIFVASLIIYSFIFEHDHYIPFIRAFFSGNIDGVYENAVQSYILHRVAYGMMMMIGIVFAFIEHSLNQKQWWWYIVAFLLFGFMIFSYCKTTILISAIIIFIYILFRLIITYKQNAKRNKIIFISLGSLLVIGGLIVGVSYLTKGKFLHQVYSLITSFTESNTLDFRSYIWDNSYQLLQNGWWLIGRGFGLYSVAVLPMNVVNGDQVYPAHSVYMGLLAECGILYLFGYLWLLGYFIYVFVKCFKKNPILSVGLALAPLSYVIYSFTEEIHYLVLSLMFPMLILYHNLYKDEKVETQIG